MVSPRLTTVGLSLAFSITDRGHIQQLRMSLLPVLRQAQDERRPPFVVSSSIGFRTNLSNYDGHFLPAHGELVEPRRKGY